MAAVTAIAGCATPPRNAALEDARIEVARARADSAVTTSAPEALRAAEDALARAESLWQQWGDPGEVSHLASLARDRAGLAQDIARQRLAAARLEAEEAQRRAAAAQAQATQAQLLAEEARARAAAAAAQAAQPDPLLREADRRARLDAELRALAARPAPAGSVVTLDDTLFEPGRAVLRRDAARTFDTLAAFLREHPERVVLVEGFTGDFRGAPINYTLSEQRTLAVRDALVARGIAGGRIEVRPFGTARPLQPGDVARGQSIDIVISDPSGRLVPR
ncbi:MAG TPA: OmpA family protein [Burkholderiales bacterium]|nr:OmpA family protein [Burkholderiales bacterium]